MASLSTLLFLSLFPAGFSAQAQKQVRADLPLGGRFGGSSRITLKKQNGYNTPSFELRLKAAPVTLQIDGMPPWFFIFENELSSPMQQELGFMSLTTTNPRNNSIPCIKSILIQKT
jgi:hypothetical protein